MRNRISGVQQYQAKRPPRSPLYSAYSPNSGMYPVTGSFTPEVTIDRNASQKVSAVGVLACAWPALLLATVCLLPYLNKPFNIDDPWFLMMAQQIIKHPAHPMDFEICWNGGFSVECRRAYQSAHGNALMGQIAQGYVLVPTVQRGAHEWMAHLTQLAFVWIAVVAITSLVLRLGWSRQHAIAGSLLLVAIPPFLAMASTAMPEILATALTLVAIERLAAWKAEHKWGQGAASAVALALASLARPHLVLLLPLAAFFLTESTSPREILAQIRRKFWLWTPVIAGVGLLLAIILAVSEHNLSTGPAPTVSVPSHILRNLLSYLLYFAFPLPLGACWLVNRLKMGRVRSVVILLAVALTVAILPLRPRLVVFLAVVGFGVLAGLLLEAWKKHEHITQFLLLWILIPLPIVYYDHLPMKYLVPCIPATILLCFQLMQAVSVRVSRAAALIVILASTSYSLLILRSDAEFARFGRDALYKLITPHVAAGERVWFEGQYWSYWYAPLDGATMTFPGGLQPKPGDLLVVDVFSAGEHVPTDRFPKRTLVDVVTHTYRFGRTMGAGEGLYSNGFGYWLWGFGDSGRDRFELWRID